MADPIVRIWHGRVSRPKADAYFALMEQVALPDYRSVPGNLAAYALRRDEDDVTHVLMLTFWESDAAIRAFAGDPVETAKYYDFDAEYLLEYEPTVTHYRLAHGSQAS
ncbi:MAG: antibiotic biosynthesis monooxygenase [Chloroflexota bacterium]|nr:antibiotic biosynthesis monooxygenase [Chloroflexota bacterium]